MSVTLHRVAIPTRQIVAGLDIDLPVFATVAVKGEETIGVGGLAWGGGRCWLFFSTEGDVSAERFLIFREARRLLRKAAQLGESEVFTVQDASFPTSERLLRMVGFEPFGEENGQIVWLNSRL